MAGERLSGKLLSVTIDGDFVQCQTDATLSITTNTSESAACKPMPGESTTGSIWLTNNVDSKTWEITLTAASFADAVQMNNADIADKLITGTPIAQVQFATTQTTDYAYDQILVYSGEGIITNFTMNAPADGESTYDVTIIGNGPLTSTRTNVTT